MPFVSCDKQISSFAAAIGTASVADKQAIINALSINKEIAYVQSENYKQITPELRPNNTILPVGTLMRFNAGGDTFANASFGSWNASKDTFSFSKTGNYAIAYDTTIQCMLQNRAVGYTNNAGSYFRIGGKDWYGGSCNWECYPDSQTFTGAPSQGTKILSISAGQTFQWYGWAVYQSSPGPNQVGLGAPSGWTWGIQIYQM